MCTRHQLQHRRARRAFAGAFVLAFVLLATLASEPPRTAEIQLAYLDPGVGSLLIQGLVAALAGVAVVLRVYWTRIKQLLGFQPVQADEKETERKAASDE